MKKPTSKGEKRFTYKTLKGRHRKEREGYPGDLSLRIHRSLSWLDAAEQATDLDTRYVMLWIAFNAAYAQEFVAERDLGEQKVFRTYVRRICELDGARLLYGIIWSEFSGSVRLLLDNRFVFKPFWEHQSGRMTETEWEESFLIAKSRAKRAIEKGDTAGVLNELFSRLYTLRNQIVHGGSTWKSAANRSQVKDGVRILERLIPTIISVMMDHPRELWGTPSYPVVA